MVEETDAFPIKKWTGYLLHIPFGINCALKGSIKSPCPHTRSHALISNSMGFNVFF